MGNNKIVPNLICRFVINHSRNVIVIECLQKSMVGLSIDLKSLTVISDQVSSSPLRSLRLMLITHYALLQALNDDDISRVINCKLAYEI